MISAIRQIESAESPEPPAPLLVLKQTKPCKRTPSRQMSSRVAKLCLMVSLLRTRRWNHIKLTGERTHFRFFLKWIARVDFGTIEVLDCAIFHSVPTFRAFGEKSTRSSLSLDWRDAGNWNKRTVKVEWFFPFFREKHPKCVVRGRWSVDKSVPPRIAALTCTGRHAHVSVFEHYWISFYMAAVNFQESWRLWLAGKASVWRDVGELTWTYWHLDSWYSSFSSGIINVPSFSFRIYNLISFLSSH